MEFLIAIPALVFMMWLLHKAFTTFKKESAMKPGQEYMNLSGSHASAKESLNEDKSTQQEQAFEGMMV
jgi:hypothetical protein